MKKSRSPKNLLLISIDALRSDALGFSKKTTFLSSKSKSLRRTPTLDRLAKSGIFYERCVSAATVTTASHASAFSGLLPHRHGTRLMAGNPLNSNVKTLFDYFGSAGFDCYSSVDFSAIFHLNNLCRGTLPLKPEKLETDIVRAFKTNPKKRKFVFLHLGDCHSPYLLGRFLGSAERKQSRKLILRLARKLKLPPKAVSLSPLSRWLELDRWSIGKAIERQALASGLGAGHYFPLYYKGVNQLDQGRLRRLLRSLRHNGFLKDTAIVIFGDHGEMLKLVDDKLEVGHAGWLNEEVIRVPLVFWHSKRPRGFKHIKQPSLLDLTPTLLDWFDIPFLRDSLDGHSLLEHHHSQLRPWDGLTESYTAEGSDLARRSVEFLATGGKLLKPPPRFKQKTVFSHSVVKGDYKLIAASRKRPMLFNLKTDPFEKRNLLSAGHGHKPKDQHKKIARQMARSLKKSLSHKPAFRAKAKAQQIQPDLLKELRDLGYI